MELALTWERRQNRAWLQEEVISWPPREDGLHPRQPKQTADHHGAAHEHRGQGSGPGPRPESSLSGGDQAGRLSSRQLGAGARQGLAGDTCVTRHTQDTHVSLCGWNPHGQDWVRCEPRTRTQLLTPVPGVTASPSDSVLGLTGMCLHPGGIRSGRAPDQQVGLCCGSSCRLESPREGTAFHRKPRPRG